MLRRVSPLLLLFLFLTGAGLAQDAPVCAGCKKEITGQYISVEGLNFHPGHFQCARCGKVITGSYYNIGGKFYHPDCGAEEKGLICKVCGKVISGDYVESGGGIYHENCFTGSVLPKCAVCGSPLSGTYTINAYGDKYHSSHAAELPECCSCYRLICPGTTGGGKRYEDGRAICNVCYPRAVNDGATLNRLMDRVRGKLSGYGIVLNRNVITIKAVDRYELSSLAGHSTPENELRGFCKSESSTEYTNGKQTAKQYKHTVYTLHGLPSLQTESVIAHELMHAWLYEHTSGNHSDAVTEGSCNYVSYLYLQSGGDAEAPRLISRMEQNPDPAYGKGFRDIRAAYNGKPLSALLEWLKKDK